MPEVSITIGGRSFDVACESGQEPVLEKAAALLDKEAQVLTGELGRLPEVKLLLLSGLMLADRTINRLEGMQSDVSQVTSEANDRITSLESEVRRLSDENKTLLSNDLAAREKIDLLVGTQQAAEQERDQVTELLSDLLNNLEKADAN